MKTGVADLPLHYGKCPRWLFPKMVKLSGEISKIIIEEYGQKEFLKRISNPFFFQALGCVLGFDWHSSGLTTTTTAALKEAFKKNDMGIFVLGGKGKSSRKVKDEIKSLPLSDKKIEKIEKASKMAAKVDNSVVQDGYTLYHHTIFVSEKGHWSIVQQGMNPLNRYARRYHWLSFFIKSFVEEPHTAIVGVKEKNALDLTSNKNKEARKSVVDVVKENPNNLKKYFYSNSLWYYFKMPSDHRFDERIYKKIVDLHEFDPRNFEDLVAFKGVGVKTIRSLTLLSKLIYGIEIDWKDPVKYSFAHGGKDGIPYPVDRKTYDNSIKILKEIIDDISIGKKEKARVLERLSSFLRV